MNGEVERVEDGRGTGEIKDGEREKDVGQEEEMGHKERERGMDVSNIMMLGGEEREKRGQLMREVILCLKK